MTLRRAGFAAAAVALLASGCGKKGPPQAPFRPDPARITEIAVRAVDTRVEVVVTLPGENADGTTPSIIDRVELYAIQVPVPAPTPADPAEAPVPAAPAVPASAIAQAEHLVTAVDLAPPAAPGAQGEPSAAASGVLTIPHDISATVSSGAPGDPVPSLRYVVVGTGRGRRGPPSAAVEVPRARRPPPPAGVSVAYTESTLTVAWDAAGEGLAAVVDEVLPPAVSARPLRRSPAPVNGVEFGMPVAMGAPVCLEVRHVLVAGRATIEGPASPVVCVTPADRFPPPAPDALVAIAEEGAVVLTWRGVTAADLAGYVVLRGEGTSETLQPLTPAPIAERSFRDATARPGMTYTYAIVAMDRASPPNRSAESGRQTVTAR